MSEKPFSAGIIIAMATARSIVTLLRCIEPFSTGIKIKSMDQEVILTKSSDQCGLNRRLSVLEEE